MTNRTGIIVVLCGLAVAAWLLFFGTRHSTTIPLPEATNQSDAIAPTASPVIGKNPTATPPALELPPAVAQLKSPLPAATPANKMTVALPAALEFTNLPPETVLENMRTAFRNYISMFRENPVGDNLEITQALNGGNRKQTHFLREEDGLRINGRGELIDSWGTPYFFHQLSGTEMEIHSAGPDRVQWTADDLIAR